MADVVVQAQDTTFQRQGNTYQYKYYSVPTVAASALLQLLNNAGYYSASMAFALARLQYFINQDPEVLPGGLTLAQIQSLDPTNFAGAAELQLLYQLDPFDTAFEINTKALYDRQFLTARSTAQSGPVNVRGGTARQALELAELSTLQAIHQYEEIWKNQLAISQVVLEAAKATISTTNQIRSLQLKSQEQQASTEQGRAMQALSATEQLNRDAETQIRAAAAAAEFLGVPYMHTEENLFGRGTGQSATMTSFGMTAWR